MKLNIDKELIDLAKLFKKNNATLFIVGGFVRNGLMGFCETDIDVCSLKTPQEIEEMLDKKNFEVNVVNQKLGTVHIKFKKSGNEYEHTTFRAEKYDEGGWHSPTDVAFVDDISLDASRRDFSINAIYYNILNDDFVDFYCGISDIKHKVLRTVETPNYVFSNDGLRILRMVRLSVELGFEIDPHDFIFAKQMISQLDVISQERFHKEILAINNADLKYEYVKNPYANVKGMQLLSKLGAWKYVLPDLFSLVKNDIEKLNEDWLNLYKIAPPKERFAALFLDFLAIFDAFDRISEFGNAIFGTNGIMLNKNEVNELIDIAEAFILLKNNNGNYEIIIQKYYNVIVSVVALLNKIGNFDVEKIFKQMQRNMTPFTLKDLKINGNDIQEHFPDLEKHKYGIYLNVLLEKCGTNPKLNTKENLISALKQILSKEKN